MNFKVGERVKCFSSVGEQDVVIKETGLSVKNPFDGHWTEKMVIVEYQIKSGLGMAHENQLRRIAISDEVDSK